MVESLKLYKDVKGLDKNVGEHILTTLNTVEKHNVKEVIECMEKRYGRTRLEKLEELVLDYIRFREDDYEIKLIFFK